MRIKHTDNATYRCDVIIPNDRSNHCILSTYSSPIIKSSFFVNCNKKNLPTKREQKSLVNIHCLCEIGSLSSPSTQESLRKQLLFLALNHQSQINNDLLRLLQSHFYRLLVRKTKRRNRGNQLVSCGIDHLLTVAISTVGELRELVTDNRRHITNELANHPRSVQ